MLAVCCVRPLKKKVRHSTILHLSYFLKIALCLPLSASGLIYAALSRRIDGVTEQCALLFCSLQVCKLSALPLCIYICSNGPAHLGAAHRVYTWLVSPAQAVDETEHWGNRVFTFVISPGFLAQSYCESRGSHLLCHWQMVDKVTDAPRH